MAGRAVAKSETESGHRNVLLLITFLSIVLCWWTSARAEPMRLAPPSVESVALTQDLPVESTPSEVVPAPVKRERYNVVVLGDSLGDGMWAGLYHVLRKDKRFNEIGRASCRERV